MVDDVAVILRAGANPDPQDNALQIMSSHGRSLDSGVLAI
jgi:hypothetical protein